MNETDSLTRKKFLQMCSTAFAAIAIPHFIRTELLSAEAAVPQLTAVRQGTPSQMIQSALKNFQFLNTLEIRNKTVVVKPNIGWNVTPELGANTNPDIVYETVKYFIEKGASRVYVFDNSADNWKQCYSSSGIEAAAKKAGAVMAPAHLESYYQTTVISSGVRLKKTKIHELVLSSDLLINLPVLKTHHSTRMTCAMKNLMGTIWNRYELHSLDLHQCIADLNTAVKPAVNIVDAYRVMFRSGPRGTSRSDLILKNQLFISNDIISADSASTKTLDIEPSKIRYLAIYGKNRPGYNLEGTEIKRLVL